MNESKKDYSVLITEDDPIIARVLETILRDRGYRVDEPVNSGEKAISRVAARRPGMALMDIDLIGTLSGVETARILLHIFGVPVIFVTGHDEEDVLSRAKEADPFGFLIKPINQNILNTTIQVGVNLYEKVCNTTEGKTSGLNQAQRDAMLGSIKPVIILDDRNRIIWMNDPAEYILERQAGELLMQDGPSSISLTDSVTGEVVDIFSLDPIDERPVIIGGTSHQKQVVPRIFLIYDPFGDIGGYYLELQPTGEPV